MTAVHFALAYICLGEALTVYTLSRVKREQPARFAALARGPIGSVAIALVVLAWPACVVGAFLQGLRR